MNVMSLTSINLHRLDSILRRSTDALFRCFDGGIFDAGQHGSASMAKRRPQICSFLHSRKTKNLFCFHKEFPLPFRRPRSAQIGAEAFLPLSPISFLLWNTDFRV